DGDKPPPEQTAEQTVIPEPAQRQQPEEQIEANTSSSKDTHAEKDESDPKDSDGKDANQDGADGSTKQRRTYKRKQPGGKDGSMPWGLSYLDVDLRKPLPT
ncbi:hypothetical protein HDU67_004432, partial [Dinochytrium kinnereticum]